jgi:hypothetical protein
MADQPALSPDQSFYQRLLARDQSEAAEVLERYVAKSPPETVYDALLLPALTHAERDRLDGRISLDEEALVIDTTRELAADAAVLVRTARAAADEDRAVPATGTDRVPVMGYAANGAADEAALQMLGRLLENSPVTLESLPTRLLSSELVTVVQQRGVRLLCIADLPPSPPSKTRYLVKKLRAACPDLQVVVGRWAPPGLADESTQPLVDAGAAHVSATVLKSAEFVRQLSAHLPRTARAAPPAA